MTEKQMLFCEEYLKDPELNATKAYLRVYTTCKKPEAAKACASRLMAKPEIKEYIRKKLDEIHDQNTADANEVMEYLTSVMRGNSKSEVLKLDGDGYQKVIEKRPEEKDRLKAAELIGKRYGMFKDNISMDSDVELNIKVDYGSDDKG